MSTNAAWTVIFDDKTVIKNNGPETISTLWVRVYFLDQNGSPFFDEDYIPISQYADMKYLKPNYTFRMEQGNI